MKLRKIRALLYENKISLIDVADRAGVCHSTARVVMSGHGTSRHIRDAVADLLGISYADLWNNNHRKKTA